MHESWLFGKLLFCLAMIMIMLFILFLLLLSSFISICTVNVVYNPLSISVVSLSLQDFNNEVLYRVFLQNSHLRVITQPTMPSSYCRFHHRITPTISWMIKKRRHMLWRTSLFLMNHVPLPKVCHSFYSLYS